MSPQDIRALALCIFHDKGRILVTESHDHVKDQRFCRPLGGGIQFGETSADALAREIREELGAGIKDLRIIGTLENIFTFLGEPHHEIIQIYDAAFADPELYKRPWLPGTESDGTILKAYWRELSYFSASSILVPNGLPELLAAHLKPG